MAAPGDDRSEIESILSDLESILSGLPPGEAALPAAPVPASAPPPPPAPAPSPAQQEPASKAPAPAQYRPPLELDPKPLPVPAATLATDPAGPEEEIPAGAPPEQIRKMAFLFASGQKSNYREFAQFLESMSRSYPKKPLYVRRALFAELAEDADAQALVEKVQASGAALTVGLLHGLSETRAHALEEAFGRASLPLRLVQPEEVPKRSTAVDLLVDLMLLSP